MTTRITHDATGNCMITVLDTACLPPAERTGVWAETTAQALVTTRFRFPDPANFGARIRTMTLGPAQLSTLSYAQLVSYRSPRLIRQSDPELYQIAVITSGRQGIEQARQNTVLGPGEIVLYDSSRPFEASAHGPGRCGSLVLQFPRRLMPLPDQVVARLCGASLGAADGVGHVFRQTLVSLTEAAPDLTARDRQRLGTAVIDLAAALIARHADRTSQLPAESRMSTLFQQITAFITQHLHDPGLGPATVAAAHHISPRYLHRIFQAHGTTVNTFIRQERMDRCRRDLADPALHATPVKTIGARWGYPRASDFTRAFRTATGLTPTEYRAAQKCARGGRRVPL
ncbi:helix-turn-helix domain-containing protein [Streptomyces echinoruber]|uniref:AraC family transcriptional regulator n=1 Tax=Streptomyces echinoruber TaxID=68898 RepID=A0A918R475_9ACTN|nr:helix-turn-helix domain-containing protein [Streptomyces echinoruber]GGZ82535.1 AraC family transcriptional regulator [Streptomyces echinoruber]